jgi:CheY-like chemotaxis protein/anti-anti-sigma regulatory factor
MALKILTVDDSRTIRMIVKKAFRHYQCELFEAENGVEGLAEAAKVKPDLIVLDITMPVMTGIEMLGKLKEDNDLSNIPVVMLTAESGKDNVMSIIKLGVKDYIVKPFKGEQLIERAQNIVNLIPVTDTKDPQSAAKDGGSNYFSADGHFVILCLPKKITRSASGKIEAALKEKIAKINRTGAAKQIKFLIDLGQVADVSMTTIQMLISLVNNVVRAKMPIRLVATEEQKGSLKGFHETSSMEIETSIEAAKTSF